MEKPLKIILIAAGIASGIAAISLAIYFVTKKQKEEDEAALAALSPAVNPPVNTIDTAAITSSAHLIAPSFNTEGELSNPIQQIKGRYIYPKPQTEGGVNYANVRREAQVNTDQGWWDLSSNELATIYAGTPIGTVISDTTSLHNGYAYRWFKVRLQTPAKNYAEGFVRADTVTFKPI